MPITTLTGRIYTEDLFGQDLVANRVSSATISDTDGIRGNGGTAEQLTLPPVAPFGDPHTFPLSLFREIVATLQFTDGTLLAVRGIVQGGLIAYGSSVFRYLFEESTLAANGKTLNDIARVVGTVAIDHALNWDALGFDAGAPPPPPVNEIFGTNASNRIIGTSGADEIHGLGGNDVLTGGGAADAFVFGAETRNGVREADRVTDYQVGVDVIAFEDAAVVRSIANIAGGVRITFEGDLDRVNVFGAGLNASNIHIVADELIPLV